MSLLTAIGFGNPSLVQLPYAELPDVFPFPMLVTDFVSIDVEVIYERILTDVLERSEKIPDKIQPLLWDNCLATENSSGLVSLLVQAMVKKQKLYIVYDRTTEIVYEAKTEEQAAIEQAAKNGKTWKEGSKTGAFISFEKRRLVDMVRLYSALEYATIAALYKSMNVAKSIQFKISDLRASVAKGDGQVAIDQAKAMADAMKAGRDLLVDAKDIIENAKPDVAAAQAALTMTNQRLARYLKMPASYIQGDVSAGLSDTGKADAKAVDRGLRSYFYSIVKPVFEALFEIKLTFRPDELDQLTLGLETARTFELISEDYISNEEKRSIIARLLGLTGIFKTPPDQKSSTVEPQSTPAVTGATE